MKQLQNNFTTKDQSKRLLELGIPIDSADMHIVYSSRDIYSAPKFNDICVSAYRSYFPTLDILPCWSVGRLIEIYGILRGVTCIFSLNTTDIIDDIIDCFERNKLEFSKLEE